MRAADLAVYVLLSIGCLSFLVTALGILLIKDFYEQVHFLAPGSLIGAIAIPAAVVVREGLSQAGAKAILIAILLVWANPVVSHAMLRAGRIRRKEQWQPLPDENIPVAHPGKE
jgi:monovalent cation/proton antiporter MnhG/PhaG subunit